MVDLAVICEGKTERLFCDQVLAPYLSAQDIALTAIEIGIECKQPGGNVSFDRVIHDARLLLTDHDYVTTMVDFFRLGKGWPDVETFPPELSSSQKADQVEHAATDAARPILGDDTARFIPNVLMHEFEALLFVDPEAIVKVTYARPALTELQKVALSFPSPEDINTGRQTAPSKRLTALGSNYGKIAHGIRIARMIGLDAIRAKCPHFDAWLTRVEGLSMSQGLR